ncbi:MAG: hypothetical protein AB7S92_07945 [Parvibaculaceae bacterium]
MAPSTRSVPAETTPREPGAVLSARTRAGYDLPIIDVTHPRFAVADDEAARAARRSAFLRDERQRRFVPAVLLRFLLRLLARKSRLAAAMVDRQSPYLDGLSTYVMKLGADNLVPPFDSPADRRFAASPHITLLRLRTQQTATLIAHGIAEDAAFVDAASLHLVNIAGGPALDSINSLLILKRRRPELLRRPIVIHVLDRNADGAFFGANALAVLREKGHPLADVDAAFRHHDYDWNAPAGLAELLEEIGTAGGVVAASSEGGLFEYGDDAAISANLRLLHDAARFVAGSVTSGDETRRRMIAMSGFKVIPRGLAGFRPLAEAARFAIVRSEPALLSDQVLLRPF